MKMDLSTTYLGLKLPHPLMPGASPLVDDLDTVRKLEDAGAAAITMHSVFEEQITREQVATFVHTESHGQSFAEALTYFPSPEAFHLGPDEYLEHLRKVKQAVSVPVVGSLNGYTVGGWLEYAKLIQDAGADALEINMYDVIADLDVPGTAVETTVRDLVLDLTRALRIPIAVKLTPFYSAFGNFARALDRAGANGLVLFNRFYQPDIDIKLMATVPSIELSHSNELPLRLRWLAILHGHVQASLALTGGVETPADGIKGLLAGANVVQLVSAVLRHGPAYFTTMREGLAQWMEWQRVESVDDMRGRASNLAIVDPGAFERASYIKTLQSWGA